MVKFDKATAPSFIIIIILLLLLLLYPLSFTWFFAMLKFSDASSLPPLPPLSSVGKHPSALAYCNSCSCLFLRPQTHARAALRPFSLAPSFPPPPPPPPPPPLFLFSPPPPPPPPPLSLLLSFSLFSYCVTQVPGQQVLLSPPQTPHRSMPTPTLHASSLMTSPWASMVAACWLTSACSSDRSAGKQPKNVSTQAFDVPHSVPSLLARLVTAASSEETVASRAPVSSCSVVKELVCGWRRRRGKKKET